MNRTEKFKIGYLGVLLSLVTVSLMAVLLTKGNIFVIAGVAFIFFVPGRIQGVYFKDFFTGRQLFDHGRFDESIKYFNKFISNLNRRPQLGKLLWLSWSIYTPSVKAMVLNNLGAAYLELGEFDKSEQYLNNSLAVDQAYPIPYFNLAVVNELLHNHDHAQKFAQKAYELGYKQSAMDKVISKSQSLLASMEGNAKNV